MIFFKRKIIKIKNKGQTANRKGINLIQAALKGRGERARS